MNSTLMFDALKMAKIEEPQTYVRERRQLIDQSIQIIAQKEQISHESLHALQDEIEQIRVINPTPIGSLKALLSLMEERIEHFESLVKTIKDEQERAPINQHANQDGEAK